MILYYLSCSQKLEWTFIELSSTIVIPQEEASKAMEAAKLVMDWCKDIIT